MQIFHGTIITCDANYNVCQYLVENKGKIEYLGNELPSKYIDNGTVIELGERSLVPSFGDGHIHYTNWALIATEYFDVRTAKNLGDFGKIIQTFVRNKKGKVGKALVGFGASKHSVEEKRLITKSELDQIYNEKPMCIICYDGHSLLANSKMVDMFPEEVRTQRGFDGEKGHLFNEAYFKGLDFATGLFSPLTLKSITKAYDLLAEKGIGLIHSVESIGFPGDLDVSLAMLIGRARSKKNDIQTRMFFQTMDVNKAMKKKLPRIGGCFATALDGCFGACDAALVEPYSHDPENKGILFYTDEEVIKFTKEANRAGMQIELHTIGDAAVKQALRAIEAALTDHPRPDHRHTIIHACLMSDEDIATCAKLGVGITLQPGFLVSPLEPSSYLEKIIRRSNEH